MGLAGGRHTVFQLISGLDRILSLIEKIRVRASDLRGISRLAIETTAGLTDLVKAMDHNVQGCQSRHRSADDVERIVRANAAQGITHFFISDNNFARNQAWEALFDRLIHLRELLVA